MMSTLAKRKRSESRRAVRTGRPPRERAGEVEARILDAARRVFLERGLAGASVDEIASLARAGKPTIYARFPGKRPSSPPSCCAMSPRWRMPKFTYRVEPISRSASQA